MSIRRHVGPGTFSTGSCLPGSLTSLLALFFLNASLTLSMRVILGLALTSARLASTEILDFFDDFAESFFDVVHAG